MERSQREIADPLSDVARKDRRMLLLLDVILVGVVFGNLIPTQVEALGIAVNAIQAKALLVLLSGVTVYFLIAFCVTAAADRQAWRADAANFAAEWLKEEMMHREVEGYGGPGSDMEAWRERVHKQREEFRGATEAKVRAAMSTYERRAFVDFVVPLLVTGLALPLCWAKILFF